MKFKDAKEGGNGIKGKQKEELLSESRNRI
jgi:hypothetical protein